jgi:hypothetical protein
VENHRLYYLSHVYGYDEQTSRELIEETKNQRSRNRNKG